MNKIIHEDIINIIKSSDFSDLKNSTIVVTGATGMLGKYVVYTLMEIMEQYNLHIILIARNLDKLKNIFCAYTDSERVIMMQSNLMSEISMEQHIDFIIHAASLASPQYYETTPVDVITPNVIGTYNLLELGRKHNVKNFLFFSSSEVYGKIMSKTNYSEKKLGVLDPSDVRNCYSESKRMGENLCVSYGKQFGLHTNSVRIYHTYGPTLDIENDKRVFSEFVKKTMAHEEIIINSDGTAMRPFCYITDAIKAFFLILTKGKFGEAYNMCNNREYISINDFAQLLVSLSQDESIKIIHKTRKENDSYSEKKDENQVTADSSKLKALGWDSEISVDEGLKRTLDSFLLEYKKIKMNKP